LNKNSAQNKNRYNNNGFSQAVVPSKSQDTKIKTTKIELKRSAKYGAFLIALAGCLQFLTREHCLPFL
jgi:hypothetical protein